MVADDELQDLIEPWLGERREGEDLPLPRLIDVSLDPARASRTFRGAGAVSCARLSCRTRPIGIQEVSEGRAERQATFFRTVGITLGVVLLLCSLAIVTVITSLSLAMHDDTVTLLRYMGAQDGYLARQFERYALHSGLRGGLIGFFAAMLTVLGVLYSIQNLEMTNSIRLGFSPVDWIFLACVPVVAALLCTLMARMTALWSLGRMA